MTKFRIGSIAILICALFSTASTITAFADYPTEYYWNASNGNWSDGTNWTPAGPPTGYGIAYIDNGGLVNIDIDIEDHTIQSMRLYNGTLNQSNYIVDPGSAFIIGRGYGNNATYNLSGGSMIALQFFTLGTDDGNGYFNMTGGYVSTAKFMIGDLGADSYGEFNISAGTVDIAEYLRIGYQAAMGNAVVNQTGGNVVVGNYLLISTMGANPFKFPYDGHGIYNMSGGTLTTGESLCVGSKDMNASPTFVPEIIYDTSIASDGRLFFTGGNITVGGNLYVYHADSYINDSAAPGGVGGTIEIWHDLRNYSYAYLDFDMRRTNVILHGGTGLDEGTHAWDCSVLDMNSEDYGASVAGLDANFALGNLVFSGQPGSSQWYRLESDIYCYGLSIEEGALVDLNGYNIYYMPQGCGAYSGITAGTFQLNGQWFNINGGNGDVIAITDAPPVPEPATIVLIGSGILALAGVIRKRMA